MQRKDMFFHMKTVVDMLLFIIQTTSATYMKQGLQHRNKWIYLFIVSMAFYKQTGWKKEKEKYEDEETDAGFTGACHDAALCWSTGWII